MQPDCASRFLPLAFQLFRGLGINIVYLGDFHDDSDISDPGPKRFMEQKLYFEGARKLSDKNFLVIPAEEVNAYIPGHWYLIVRPLDAGCEARLFRLDGERLVEVDVETR